MSEQLIAALNTARDAQQAYADAHVAKDGDPISEALYEATYELCHRVEVELMKPSRVTPE